MFDPDRSSPRGPLPNDGRPIFLPGLGQGFHRNQPRLSVRFHTTNEEIQESQIPVWDDQTDNTSLILVPDSTDSYLTVPGSHLLPVLETEENGDEVDDAGSEQSQSRSHGHHHHKKKKGFFGFGKKKHHHHERNDQITIVDENGEEVVEYLEDGQIRRASVLSGSLRSQRSSATAASASQSGSSGSYASEDDFEQTVFMENLDEDLQEALQDGEDFDYSGLFSHPTHDLDEDILKENITTQKEIVGKIKDQPWRMRRKLKLYRIAQFYIERYEGRLSKGRANVANVTKLYKQVRRTLGNIAASLQPWEERIKSIENRFGSAAASFFLLLRWIIWVNIIQTILVVSFVMVPEIITGQEAGTDFRKTITDSERKTSLNFEVIYRYGGFIKYTPIFYGWYGDTIQFPNGYRLPLAYFVTTICIFVHSFWVVLSKMAANVREGSNVSSGDQFHFTLRTYSSWDYMIANRDTADNKVAAISRSFKELISEERHDGEEMNKWLRLFLRVLAWFITACLLALAFYILYLVMDWKQRTKLVDPSYVESNAVGLTLKGISMVFPEFFERLEIIEEYHPLTALKLHLSRIAMLALVTNYALIDNWVKEAGQSTEEASHVKDDFMWIWNDTLPRPPNWQTQIAIIHPTPSNKSASHNSGGHSGTALLPHLTHSNMSQTQISHAVHGAPSGHGTHTNTTHMAPGQTNIERPPPEPDFSLADGDFDFDAYFGIVRTSTSIGTTVRSSDMIDHDELTHARNTTTFAANSTTVHSVNVTVSTSTVNTWPTRQFQTRPPTTPRPTTPVTLAPIDIAKLKDLCWENKVAGEGLENLVTESITSVIEVLVTEFIRGLFVRFLAKCWFWDLESVPGYPSFRISENVINLITGQQMAWLGFFFAPALIPINLTRLVFLMYFRSWITQVCDVPPETMFNTGQGNNFYFYILLLMLFISTLFIGYTVCFLPPSWSCGPFSRYKLIFEVLTETISNNLSPLQATAVEYITSPAIVVPLLMLLFIIIFYLFTVRMALTKQTKNLKRTLEIERMEEKRKMLSDIEAKRKKEEKMLLGASGADDAAEITIEQARNNADTLLDKMKNRGFPPEEQNSAVAPVEVSRRLMSGLMGGSHMRNAIGKVVEANIIVRRLSDKGESSDGIKRVMDQAITIEQETPAAEEHSTLPITKLLKTRDKFRKKRKKPREPEQTENAVDGDEVVVQVEHDEDAENTAIE